MQHKTEVRPPRAPAGGWDVKMQPVLDADLVVMSPAAPRGHAKAQGWLWGGIRSVCPLAAPGVTSVYFPSSFQKEKWIQEVKMCDTES